jgi:hypothetical protein
MLNEHLGVFVLREPKLPLKQFWPHSTLFR